MPLTYTNVYFSYNKNPHYNWSFNSQKIMLFRVNYEYIIQSVIENNKNQKIPYSFNKKFDKLIKTKITMLTKQDGKIVESKLKKKYYEIEIANDSLIIKPNINYLNEGETLRVYCLIESSNFYLKNLAPRNKNKTNYLSFNIPEIFHFNIDDSSLKLIEQYHDEMQLKTFSYNNNNAYIGDRNVITNSFKWEIISDTVEKIKFPLVSINLPFNVGSSVDEIMNVSVKK